MAQFFKRRARASPNKNEEKVQRSREAASQANFAGVLGQRFPTVERLSVQLEFVNPQSHSVEHQTRLFSASDSCDFKVPCPGRCGQGSYDLAGKIQAVVDAHESSSEGNGICQEPLYAGSPEVCGYQLKCKIEVRYLPQPAPVQGGPDA
jgi:hypothetical protein